jgi:hypothetical protein
VCEIISARVADEGTIQIQRAGLARGCPMPCLPIDEISLFYASIEISNKFGFVLPKWKMLRFVYGIILPIRSSRRGHGAISSMSTRLVNLIRRIFMLRVVAKS